MKRGSMKRIHFQRKMKVFQMAQNMKKEKIEKHILTPPPLILHPMGPSPLTPWCTKLENKQ